VFFRVRTNRGELDANKAKRSAPLRSLRRDAVDADAARCDPHPPPGENMVRTKQAGPSAIREHVACVACTVLHPSRICEPPLCLTTRPTSPHCTVAYSLGLARGRSRRLVDDADLSDHWHVGAVDERRRRGLATRERAEAQVVEEDGGELNDMETSE